MPEVFVKFNSLEEAMAALQGANTAHAVPSAPAAPAPFVPAAPAAPAPAQYVAPAPAAPAPVAAPAPAAQSAYTQANVVAQSQQYAKVHGPKAVKAVFAEFGVDAVSKLDPTQYAAVMARLAV